MKRLSEDPYVALGVAPDVKQKDVRAAGLPRRQLTRAAVPRQIKKAYHRLALRFHPDKNDATAQLFVAVRPGAPLLRPPPIPPLPRTGATPPPPARPHTRGASKRAAMPPRSSPRTRLLGTRTSAPRPTRG